MLSQSAKVAALRSVPLFRRLAKATMFEIVRRSTTVTHPDGTALVAEGDPGDFLGVIVRGAACVERGGSILGELKEGDYFGEMSLIDGRPRSASVVATGEVVMLVVNADDFDALLKIPYVARAVMEGMSQRIRELQEQSI